MKIIHQLAVERPPSKRVSMHSSLVYEINNFVKKLTENINKDDEVPEISDTKFRALKKII